MRWNLLFVLGLMNAFLLVACDDSSGGGSGGTGGSSSSSSSGGGEAGTGGTAGTGGAAGSGGTAGMGGGGGGLPDGAVCGQSANGAMCGPGLACCYPCGIPDCDWKCTPACDPNSPGCANGCIAAP
ncbi:MAG: hypothetical protein IPM54_10100 [Polyangiaceae bacterium]|nr:hypothetical protein [Polyangiaceae bacterium]